MFTNTASTRPRAVRTVTAMMEHWEACFFVLILDFTFAKDLIQNSTYVIREIESCPDVGYFFQRELAPNVVQASLCYLCFCREDGTAVCWERELRRCDVEKYHHHRVGRQSRYRRSFGDVFLRDSTRDFFGKNLPQQCKPHDSFSDGCPPADWCVGCTICDCDSNGRWDCHVLSFCDGKESKKTIMAFKDIRNIKKRNKKSRKSKDYDAPVQAREKPANQAPTREMTKKVIAKPKPTKPPKNTWKKIKKVVKAKPSHKASARTNKSAKQSSIKQQTMKKYPRKLSNAMSQNVPKTNVSRKKIYKKAVATRRPVSLNRNAVKGLKINPNNSDSVKLGQKIVNQVVTTFKKMLSKKLNETRRSRLMEGKDCGGVRKRDKRTYNVRSKAAARNKSKYNKQGLFQDNYTNSRIKREILTEPAEVEQNYIITLPTDANAVIPLDTVKETSYAMTSPDNVTSVPSTTLQHKNNYYEYSIKNDSSSTSTSKSILNITENIQNNLVIPVESNSELPNIIKKNDTNAINPNFNVLNFSKWYIIKIKSDERKKQVNSILIPKPSTTKSYEYGKNTNQTYFVSKIQKKHLEPKHGVTKTFNLTTLLSKVCKMPCCTNASKSTNKTDITSLKSILQNLSVQLNKTNAEKRKNKSKVSAFKYVRKFFHKLFSNKRSESHKIYGLGTKEDHTLQILCDNFGPCKLKQNSRMILKYKLKQLNKETKTVLKSIRTVKGLLHLLELPRNERISYTARNSSFQNDIQKLSVVLRDDKDDDINSSVTFTQKTQIEYIKKNTQQFIESVKKFADILTDILAIIKPKVNNEHSLKSPLKQQNYTSSLKKIKKILYQYNIIQNTFMRKMYELISGVEKKGTTSERVQIPESYRKQPTSDDMIEKNSKNILENLRKLKNIAQVVSPKRKKRELIVKDDALEYLLSLMEMLIRKNHHLDTIPVNDGIDLLIDAIKNAPDIKPITKKDLEYAPIIPVSKLTSIIETSEQQSSDGNNDSKKKSDEENPTDFEDNGTSRDIIYTDTSIKPETIDDNDTTQKVYYRLFNQPNNNEDDTTEHNSITKKQSNNEREKIGFDKFESYLGDPKKLEAETAYIEDEAVGDFTDATTTVKTAEIAERQLKDHVVFKNRIPKRTTAYTVQNNESNSESQDSTNDKRSRIEWVEEAFDREIRMINMTTSTKRTTTQTTTTTAKTVENNSDLTKEEHTDTISKKSAIKSKSHDVLYEKQMQFLNSLDYGTEKSVDFEEPEAKEDSRSDDIPSYFV